MNMSPIASPPEWEAARKELLVKEEWEGSPEGYPQTPPYRWWNYHDAYCEEG